MKTGMIGSGTMGFPIAINLHQTGHLVCAWNRTHATAEALLPALTAGAIIVDTSTVSAATARDMAQRVAAQGAQFLDAPVSGDVEGAKNAALAMMVGGDAAAYDKVQPVLRAIAKRIVHMGPSGSGQAAKAVNQIMAAGINQAVTEALSFAQAMQLPLDKVLAARRVTGSSVIAGAPWYRAAMRPVSKWRCIIKIWQPANTWRMK